MAGNFNLHAANRAKKDEFYTQLIDIENELKHYKNHFKGKTVFCNCDDPESSNFWRFFNLNFENYGLKRLLATHFEDTKQSYMLEMWRDENGTHSDIRTLRQNGDFRSPECIELLKQSDIVVTNPPFSLFREYVAQLIAYNKQFVIIGNINALTYKEVFPLIKENKMWIGASIHSGDREFRVPDTYPITASGFRIEEDGTKFIRVKGVRWFTNLDFNERHEDLILYKRYTPEEYPSYDNYNAINVDKTADIPCDYYGVLGVPITFMDKYNPDQFEIVGITDRQDSYGFRTHKYTVEEYDNANDLNARACLLVDGKPKALYARLLIKRKDNRNEN